jgi:hypothetical protein
VFLEASFRGQKTGYKPCLGRVLKAFSYHFNFLPWSDPQPQVMVVKLLDIFRVFYNFVELGRDKQTPAMRLGLAKGKITIENIIYYQ